MNDATASTAQTKTPTLQDIERMVALVEAMPPEPIGEWMRQLGFSPEQWRVVLPETMRARIVGPALWPDYVAFSSVIDRPVFVPRAQGLGLGRGPDCRLRQSDHGSTEEG